MLRMQCLHTINDAVPITVAYNGMCTLTIISLVDFTIACNRKSGIRCCTGTRSHEGTLNLVCIHTLENASCTHTYWKYILHTHLKTHPAQLIWSSQGHQILYACTHSKMHFAHTHTHIKIHPAQPNWSSCERKAFLRHCLPLWRDFAGGTLRRQGRGDKRAHAEWCMRAQA